MKMHEAVVRYGDLIVAATNSVKMNVQLVSDLETLNTKGPGSTRRKYPSCLLDSNVVRDIYPVMY